MDDLGAVSLYFINQPVFIHGFNGDSTVWALMIHVQVLHLSMVGANLTLLMRLRLFRSLGQFAPEKPLDAMR